MLTCLLKIWMLQPLERFSQVYVRVDDYAPDPLSQGMLGAKVGTWRSVMS